MVLSSSVTDAHCVETEKNCPDPSADGKSCALDSQQPPQTCDATAIQQSVGASAPRLLTTPLLPFRVPVSPLVVPPGVSVSMFDVPFEGDAPPTQGNGVHRRRIRHPRGPPTRGGMFSLLAALDFSAVLVWPCSIGVVCGRVARVLWDFRVVVGRGFPPSASEWGKQGGEA